MTLRTGETRTLHLLREHPGMYLGPKEGTRRMRQVLIEGLTAFCIDAAFSDPGLVIVTIDGSFVTIHHSGRNTPLTSSTLTLESLDAVFSKIGAQALTSGIVPWTRWSGFPVVNAFSDELSVHSTTPVTCLGLNYRAGMLVGPTSSDSDDRSAGLYVRFRPDPILVGREVDLEGATRELRQQMPEQIRDRVKWHGTTG